jgi:hypothetical protein
MPSFPCPDAIIPLVAAAPQLTKLDMGCYLGSEFRRQLVDALTNHRCCVEVTLHNYQRVNIKDFEGLENTPVLRLNVFAILLRERPAGHVRLTCFTRLKCLELVHVESDAEMEVVAELTRLTRLALDTTSPSVMPLSQLTALQELKIRAQSSLDALSFRQAVSPMVQLRELTLGGSQYSLFRWAPDFTELDSLLPVLPAITCLVLEEATQSMLLWPPAGFRRNGFAGLRKLSLSLLGFPVRVTQLATVLPGLEALTFIGNCQLLLSHPAPMPRLTELEAEHRDPNVDLPYVSGNVLARFPGLQQLCLRGMLDVEQWNEDVEFLARLTNLRVLRISFVSCYCPESFLRRYTIEKLMVLTALKQLRLLELSSVLVFEPEVAKFWEAMKAIRHEMGFSCPIVPSHTPLHLKIRFLEARFNAAKDELQRT